MDQIKRSRELIERAKQNSLDLIRIDLGVARTSVKIAVDSTNREKILRNRGNARKAYDAVIRFLLTAEVEPNERKRLDREIASLKSSLIQLGDTFPA